MRASFNHWVRKLIGKLGVPYNRRLGVRGSSHRDLYTKLHCKNPKKRHENEVFSSVSGGGL